MALKLHQRQHFDIKSHSEGLHAAADQATTICRTVGGQCRTAYCDSSARTTGDLLGVRKTVDNHPDDPPCEPSELA